jgi:hypothetical protein
MEPISILLSVLIFISLILYVLAIYDIIKNRSRFNKRVYQGIWLMVIVFIPIIGSIIYLSFRNSIR